MWKKNLLSVWLIHLGIISWLSSTEARLSSFTNKLDRINFYFLFRCLFLLFLYNFFHGCLLQWAHKFKPTNTHQTSSKLNVLLTSTEKSFSQAINSLSRARMVRLLRTRESEAARDDDKSSPRLKARSLSFSRLFAQRSHLSCSISCSRLSASCSFSSSSWLSTHFAGAVVMRAEKTQKKLLIKLSISTSEMDKLRRVWTFLPFENSVLANLAWGEIFFIHKNLPSCWDIHSRHAKLEKWVFLDSRRSFFPSRSAN